MLLASMVVLALPVVAGAVTADPTGGTPGGGTPGTASNFRLIGHDPLFGRGMDAAIALFGHYVYVGNRTAA